MTAGVGPNSGDNLVGQLCLRVLTSPWWITTALGTHITQVLGLCSEKKMCWIDAAGIVAAMTDYKPRLYRPAGELVGDSMGKQNSPVATGDLAVATLLGGRKPWPTFTNAPHIHLLPETLSQWARLT